MSGVANKTIPEDLTVDERDRLAAITAAPLTALRQLQRLEAKLAKYEEERRLERARRFGASSEANEDQYRLFNEADVLTDLGIVEDDSGQSVTDLTAPKAKRRPKRKPLPADLPRVVVQHNLPADQQRCPCGCQLSVVGEKVSEQLDVKPAQLQIIEHRRTTYSCPRCDETIKTTP